MMTETEVLERTLSLLQDPSKWAPTVLCVNDQGVACFTDSKNVSRYSILGAVLASAGSGAPPVASRALDTLRSLLPDPPKGLYFFEGQATHDQVLSLLQRAISTSQGKGLSSP